MPCKALITLLALAVALLAAAPALASSPPGAIPLTRGWEYHPDPRDTGFAERLGSGSGGVGWTPVTVPHVMDGRPLESVFGGSVGWYRLRFEGPAEPGSGWALRFEGVRRHMRAWLNGREIGSHYDPYSPVTVPATGLVPGVQNVLVVRVDNRKGAEPREGWWNWGGIVRPVRLVPRGRLALDDLGLLPSLRCASGPCTASVLFDATVINRSGAALAPQLGVRLRSPAGVVTQKTVTVRPLGPGAKTRVRFTIPVQGPIDLWTPDRPQRYEAIVHTRAGETLEQADQLMIGLRSVRVRKGRLLLNGRPLRLRGASIQEDVPNRGPALTDRDIEQIVRELKEIGADVTRAHYTLDERLLTRLDEEGILVWSQAPIYHRDRLLRHRAQRQIALEQVRAAVLAARNHPSVIVHSVANEPQPAPDAATGRWLRAAAALVRDLDPTRPVGVDLLSYPGYERQRTFAAFDVLGINSYFGWYRGKPNRSTARLPDLDPFLREFRRNYPRQATVITEFGAEATFAGPPNVKESYAFQAQYVNRVLDIVDRHRWLGGALYWTLREFAVKPRWDGGVRPRAGVARDSIHNKGLISYDGRRKPAWEVARDRFRAAPSYHGE